ncbi:hypothetical protein BDY19DRAFT_462378 [Irpex rosettiformis]|uniref:Uncharacterized protein n=1 Tax=Irpex rosettiformis TaxID=378272 RepID=A0ACB8TSW7_9APHY|nr:hypothetical protein BDY19DRAFT_462378 [Irpex rosettiformis]
MALGGLWHDQWLNKGWSWWAAEGRPRSGTPPWQGFPQHLSPYTIRGNASQEKASLAVKLFPAFVFKLDCLGVGNRLLSPASVSKNSMAEECLVQKLTFMLVSRRARLYLRWYVVKVSMSAGGGHGMFTASSRRRG